MVTQSLNTPDRIEQRLGYSDDSYGETELQRVLEKSFRRLEMKVGRQQSEVVVFNEYDKNDNLILEKELKLRPVLEVDKIRVGDTVVNSEDYTVDKESGTITFADNFEDDYLSSVGLGLSVREATVSYIPKQYKDLEYWLAVKEMLAGNIVQVDEDVLNTTIDQAEKEVYRLQKMINRTRVTGSFTDGRVNRGFK